MTLSLPFGIVGLHTVTNSKKMRTKTLLLSAAVLAAGLVASQAQNVYSANVVGYVTFTSKTNAPAFEVINNPLTGTTNTLKGLFPTGL